VVFLRGTARMQTSKGSSSETEKSRPAEWSTRHRREDGLPVRQRGGAWSVSSVLLMIRSIPHNRHHQKHPPSPAKNCENLAGIAGDRVVALVV